MGRPPDSAFPAPRAAVLLDEAASGDVPARQRLDTMVYQELRTVAARQLRGERVAHTLQPTALVHEAYLRLLGGAAAPASRTRFLALAAATMRRVLVDHARRRRARKREGYAQRVTLDPEAAIATGLELDVLAVDEALEHLARLDQRQARIVELRFFGGLTAEEVAATLEVSRGTVQADWNMARAWLYGQLAAGERDSGA